MTTESSSNADLVRTNSAAGQSLVYHGDVRYRYSGLLKWSLHSTVTSDPIVSGHVAAYPFLLQQVELQKLQRRRRERLAAVSLDDVAKRLLQVMNRETSIRWEELSDEVASDWTKVCRATALLAEANLCEVSPTRFRLSDYGAELLSQSTDKRDKLADEQEKLAIGA